MTLNEYMAKLMKFVAENPTAGEMLVITAKDDEGNGYYPICHSPTMGYFEDGEFVDVDARRLAE